MTPPLLTTVAQDLYDSLAPLAYGDKEPNYPLAQFCQALANMFQGISDIVRDVSGQPGWTVVLNPDHVPIQGLAWTAQLAGVQLRTGLTDAQQRQRVKNTGGQKRGTVAAIRGAAQQRLTGAQTVIIRERDAVASPADPSAGITVITYTSQTPDPVGVLADLMEQKPAGLILNYVTATGQDYQTLRTNNATYAALRTKYATYEGLRRDQPGT